MFIGHFAVGLASKRWAPHTRLGYLLAAPLLLDLLWPILVLLGVERFEIAPSGGQFLQLRFTHYPWSHSLLMAVVWALLVALWCRSRGGAVRTALVLGVGVVSHWVLDWVTHIPDLPLWPGGPLTGLGLWQWASGAIVVEAMLLVAGAWLYLSSTRSRDRIGRLGIWGYLALLGALYAQSVLAPPPPPDWERAIASVGIGAALLLIGLAQWVDGHREAVGTPPAGAAIG